MDNFEVFGQESFQTQVIKALIADPAYAQQIIDILEPEYFTGEGHRLTFEFIKDSIEKKSVFPSVDVVGYWMNEDLEDSPAKEHVNNILIDIKDSDSRDLTYVKEKSIKFCQNQAMKNAILQSANLLQQGDYDAIYKEVEYALMAGRESDIGHIYFEDLNKRNQKIFRKPIATGLGAPLDEVLGGGVASGELACVLAPTGVGKSMALTNLAYGAISQGLNAVYYTLELSESQVGVRVDARICNIPMEQVYKTPNVVGKILESVRDDYGRLIIKQFPTKGATVTSLKAHLAKLRTAKFEPDIVLVDYADLLRPITRFKEKRHELESLYEDLRGMAVEMKIPIWTASQSNRQSMDQDIVTLSDISESFAKAQVSDIIITLQRSAEDKRNNRANMFVAKNRAGRDGITMPVVMDTSTAYIEVLSEDQGWMDEVESIDSMKKNEGIDSKERIKKMLERMSS